MSPEGYPAVQLLGDCRRRVRQIVLQHAVRLSAPQPFEKPARRSLLGGYVLPDQVRYGFDRVPVLRAVRGGDARPGTVLLGRLFKPGNPVDDIVCRYRRT